MHVVKEKGRMQLTITKCYLIHETRGDFRTVEEALGLNRELE
jgi:hypothetical protein